MPTKLAKSDVAALWKHFTEFRDHKTKNALIEQYLPIVRFVAERLMTKLPQNVEVDDLASAGIFGLMDAIERFEPERNIKFETYCTNRIRGAILDELRNLDWVPRLVRAQAHRLERSESSLTTRLGRTPTEPEIAGDMNCSVTELREIRRETHTAAALSSHKRWTDTDDETGLQTVEIVEDPHDIDPSREIQKKELVALVTRGLSRKERLILLLYYYEELTMKEIGAALDLSESRVCQIHTKIIVRLKEELSRRKADLV
ncbi:MAG: FliA/WhiG family RNA polymerase sigma factor [Candidatus Brocadiae bacterium]|nr:FliA/WhiG family RNA polymerase sigma factor [Candidatus Brocadiia bacterium]